MDLWILSQNKNQLVKTNVVKCSYFKDKLTNDELHIITNDDYDFGIYKTEERALEVLNDIFSLLARQDLIKVIQGSTGNSMIYEMPKE